MAKKVLIAIGLLLVGIVAILVLENTSSQTLTIDIEFEDEDLEVAFTHAAITVEGEEKNMTGILLNKSVIDVTLVQIEVSCQNDEAQARHNLTAGIVKTDEGYEPEKVPKNTPYAFTVPINGLEHNPSECKARTVSWSRYERN